ncbi:hypothetical protein POPTR_007G109700v4 [Populus trichocarpa]|nr:hypothetical protein BDE02_07G102300 [Populus trichocarpa]KAI5582706.1 hypothetical protein BDE02_07G102300 [Populus trichocarpa]KAI9391590.1 hypothetical protein POPTR_007G109700v4 [Populus trichocarpa]PNT28290.1 hypothetical protein POPTR_007G109700v4 [Populus trichocarpa]|eukprot:XP_002309896.1 uncharacterized protein LOC7485066 [Populus trichocarpa]
MGSLEEERLVQMVRDFIESESSAAPTFTASSNCLSINQVKYLTLQEILGIVTEAEAEVLETLLKHMRSKSDAEKTTSKKLWLMKRLKMDGFNASLCQTSWVTSLGCPAGDYEYIDITLEDENGGTMRLIVDLDFRSQFELARPTPFYKELTDTLPLFFVGSEDKLHKIISLLCSAAKQSLKERGLHLPPWRTSTYMQSKWLSRTCKVASATNIGYSNRENREAKNGYSSMWSPPMVKPKRRGWGGGSGGSGLSSQPL